jgi:beta-glucosidase
MKKLIPYCMLFSLTNAAAAQEHNSQIQSALSKMTLNEKVQLLVGKGMKLPGKDSAKSNAPVVGQTMDKVEGAAGTTHEITRLGLSSIVVADGPAGLRISPKRESDPSKAFYCTAFPVATLLASTWDTALVQQVGTAMGSEVKAYGVDILLAPALNIHRNPLGGRNFEYYSEDPVVSGNIAAAMVNGIQSNAVGTSIKHFAVNNQETNRNQVNVIISERALREMYLKGFEIVVKKSQPWTVMSSYNKLNGTYTSEDYDLLTTILRKEWGFKGLVMTDWFGGKDPVAQMKAGNDLLMPGTPKQIDAITNAVKSGGLSMKVLDENVARMMKLIFQTQSYKKLPYNNVPDLKSNAQISKTAAMEGMVLLKNDSNCLPIAKSVKDIAVFGNTSYDFISGGTGSGDVNEAYTVSLIEGLSNAGYKLDAELKNLYTTYNDAEKAKRPKKGFLEEMLNPTPRAPELVIDKDLVEKQAVQSAIALITIGRNAGEGTDRKVQNDFNLSEAEQNLVTKVVDAFHAKNKKVIVVLNVGGVTEIASWRDKVDAILLAWQPGLEAGNAVADILTGKVNPSGKLASTFPVRYEDVPSVKNFPGRNLSDVDVEGPGGVSMGHESEVIYEDGIYVGYRYYNTFNVKPAYEFGYGLSFTNFDYSNLKLSSPNFEKTISASIDITNTGKTAGKEVVQLYLAAPTNKLAKPQEELKAFAKTNLLQPGQKQTIKFVIDAKDLASFDPATTSWIADAGKYEIRIGASSRNIKQSAPFQLTNQLVVEKCNKVLVPKQPINEMNK